MYHTYITIYDICYANLISKKSLLNDNQYLGLDLSII